MDDKRERLVRELRSVGRVILIVLGASALVLLSSFIAFLAICATMLHGLENSGLENIGH